MNRRSKKARAKRRSALYAAEKVCWVLAYPDHDPSGILRHGRSVTFFNKPKDTT